MEKPCATYPSLNGVVIVIQVILRSSAALSSVSLEITPIETLLRKRFSKHIQIIFFA